MGKWLERECQTRLAAPGKASPVFLHAAHVHMYLHMDLENVLTEWLTSAPQWHSLLQDPLCSPQKGPRFLQQSLLLSQCAPCSSSSQPAMNLLNAHCVLIPKAAKFGFI